MLIRISIQIVPSPWDGLFYSFGTTGTSDKGSPGRCQLYINDKLVGNLEIPYSTPNMFGVLGLSTGYAAFDSVDPAMYQIPFTFTGKLKQVVVDVSGEVIKDDETEIKRMMTQQ